MRGRAGRKHRGTLAWTLWLAAVCPLWALWASSWISLWGVQDEIREMSRYYGVHVYKEHLRGQLGRVAEVVERAEAEGNAEEKDDRLGKELALLALLSGLEPHLLFLMGKEFQILYPLAPVRGPLSFLDEPEPREALFRAVRQMVRQQAQEGYLSLSRSAHPNPQADRWFLVVEPAGEHLLCLLLLPEDKVDRSGSTLEGALSAMLKEKLRRYLLLTVSFLIVVSGLIGLLVRSAGAEPDRSGT